MNGAKYMFRTIHHSVQHILCIFTHLLNFCLNRFLLTITDLATVEAIVDQEIPVLFLAG